MVKPARVENRPLKILIAPDKFKGTLTAKQAAAAIAKGWHRVRPQDQFRFLPMADGGDGFGEIIGELIGAQRVELATVDARNRPRDAFLWWQPDTRVAVIEAAQSNGLALLPPGHFHPFELSTRGVGALFQTAMALGAREALVGIGGSATNDGGFGMARALGWKFLDGSNREIDSWTRLDQLASVQAPTDTPDLAVTAAVDVQNPLLGPMGCSRIYGPQKGLRPEDMEKAEACLATLARVVGQHFADMPGAGAAGGLGFGLAAFMGARFEAGADIFARAARLDERLKDADIFISGEGSLDAQSFMGKGVGAVLRQARAAGVRAIALAGGLSPDIQSAMEDRDLRLYGIVPKIAALEEAKRNPAVHLESLASLAAREL